MSSFLLLFCLLLQLAQSQENPMTHPVGGEQIPIDIPYTIAWDENTPGPVFIQLSYGDNIIATNITASTKNSGSYIWTPVSFYTGSDYFLVLCDVEDVEKAYCSYTNGGRFAVVNPSASGVSSTIGPSTSVVSTGISTSSIGVTIFPTFTVPTTTFSASGISSTTSSTKAASTSSVAPSGLPLGSEIAIAIIIPLLVIAIVVLAFFLLRNRRRAKKEHSNSPTSEPKSVQTKYAGEEMHAESQPSMLGGGDILEMPAGHEERVYELCDDRLEAQ